MHSQKWLYFHFPCCFMRQKLSLERWCFVLLFTVSCHVSYICGKRHLHMQMGLSNLVEERVEDRFTLAYSDSLPNTFTKQPDVMLLCLVAQSVEQSTQVLCKIYPQTGEWHLQSRENCNWFDFFKSLPTILINYKISLGKQRGCNTLESSLKFENMPTFCRSDILLSETTIVNESCSNCNGSIISCSPRGIKFSEI